MPFLANDRLDPERTHGDLLLTITSAHEDVNLFALRQLMRVTRGTLALHWMLDGYNRRTEARPGEAGNRNLMGFIDGTANLDHDDDGGDGPLRLGGRPTTTSRRGPPAARYHVVRVIRMLVEFWDRTRLGEQEALIGRQKANGAPLDGEPRPTCPTSPPTPTARSRRSTPTSAWPTPARPRPRTT